MIIMSVICVCPQEAACWSSVETLFSTPASLCLGSSACRYTHAHTVVSMATLFLLSVCHDVKMLLCNMLNSLQPFISFQWSTNNILVIYVCLCFSWHINSKQVYSPSCVHVQKCTKQTGSSMKCYILAMLLSKCAKRKWKKRWRIFNKWWTFLQEHTRKQLSTRCQRNIVFISSSWTLK